MKKKMTKLVAMVLMLIMCTSSTAYANNIVIEDNNDFMAEEYLQEGERNLSRWSYTSWTSENLSISSSGTATMSSSVTGYSGTTSKIVIYFYLQKYDGTWKNVKTYRDEITDWFADKTHTYSGLEKGYKYRLRCTYYVYGPDAYHYDYFMNYTPEQYY